MQRALVTGGTGFVGANLVAGLNERGITARVLRRPSSSLKALEGLEYETAFGDILDDRRALVEAMADCDWVFHVAAVADYWRQGAERVYRVNVEGTKNVLAAAQAAGVPRFVFTSSLASLGLPAPGHTLDESCQFNLRPEQFPYGHSKHLAEIEVRKAVEAGLAAVIVNPSVVIGPRDVNQISGSFIVEAANGRLRFYSPGGVNWIAVGDVVAGHIAAAERGRVGERYILGGENLSYRMAISAICEVVGQRPPTLSVPDWILPAAAVGVRAARLLLGNRVPLDANQVQMAGVNIYANPQKAIQELNLPQTPFRLAVQQTYEWYNKNGYVGK
ncbi:MAG: NAD-dependent epimerase/dehydratase family protein [Chloroflexota bacterium]